MKKIALSLFLFSPALVFAITPETTQDVSTPVKSVILYLNGAEVTHNAQVNLSAGRNKIVFVGLSSKLISKSVQVTASGSVAILSVSDQVNYLSKQEENARIKQLKDSVEYLNDHIRLLQNDRDAYDTEKKMLLTNQSIGGNDKGVAIAELKSGADFYRARIKEINAETYKIDKSQKKFTDALTKVNQQLSELNAKFNTPSAEVTVLLSSDTKSTATIELRYLVGSVGWAPIYDIKAEDVDKPIELKYRANVFNNSGFDWNDVKIKLSTSDPMLSAAQPKLDAWYLDYNQPSQRAIYQNQDILKKSPEGYMYNAPMEQQSYQQADAAIKNVVYEDIQVSELSAEFDIKTAYTIPSDSKPYLVDVTTHTLQATYQHFCVPKIDRDAFLLARITGWEELDLVEGPANVYYSGTYIGQSYIYTRSVDDTLNISLGRDRKVLVTRSKLKDMTNVKLIGSTKKETYGYEIVVKNNRKGIIHIEIQDQLPVSKQGDISVEILELSKAEQDINTGKLKWNFTIPPDENKRIELSFAIKYPKNKNLVTKKYRSASRAKF